MEFDGNSLVFNDMSQKRMTFCGLIVKFCVKIKTYEKCQNELVQHGLERMTFYV